MFLSNSKRPIIIFLLVLSWAAGAAGQRTRPNVNEQNLRTHVTYLASDKMEGRRTGEPGATFAAGYIANIFAQIKLKPGVAQVQGGKVIRSYLQPFRFVRGVEIAPAGNEFRLSVKNAANQRVPVETSGTARLVPISPSAEVPDAPVVFAGFGIASDELRFDDYRDLDVRGRVVLAFDGAPDNDPSSPWARFDARAKASIARAKGAVGLLLISREADLEKDQNVRLAYDPTLGETALPVFALAPKTAASLLGLREEELKTLENLASLKKDSTLQLKIGFPDTAPRVSLKTNLVKTEAEAYNVVGILEGTDPSVRNEAVVVGAHYDHLGLGGAGTIHYGADDNASGVAAMLEIARQFARLKNNRRTVIFVAFGGAEEGLAGSGFYAASPAHPLPKTVAMINLEMVGRLKDDKLTIGGIGSAREWEELLIAKNEIIPALGGARPKGGPAAGSPRASDSVYRFNLQLRKEVPGLSAHSAFYARQIPVLFISTGLHGDYHKPSDTADKINYAGLRKIAEYVSDVTSSVANFSKGLTFTPAPSTGTADFRSRISDLKY